MGNCVSLQTSCDKALNNACSSLFGEGNCLHMMEENLEDLRKAMQELVERRDDFLRRVVVEEDEGLQRLDKVQEWLSKVDGVESQVNGLLEVRSTQTSCGNCCLNFISGGNYGRKILKKLSQVEKLVSDGVFQVVTEKLLAPKAEKKHIPVTVGLDSKVKTAWDSLMEDGPRTLGLKGTGGIGKTTVLAGINNKFLEVENEFDVVIWVVVAKDMQYQGVQDQIWRRLGLDKEWEQETTEEERAFEIYKILNEKKFVLLLDDLWSKVNLKKVGVPRLTHENGSKIVFTTRSEEVCKDMEADDVMEVVPLSKGKSWKLFQKQVGELEESCLPHAKKVAGMCYGLPLALNLIAQSMIFNQHKRDVDFSKKKKKKRDLQEWQGVFYALNLANHEFARREERRFLSCLKVAYDRFGDERVKLMLLYCCLFPEGYEIDKSELIQHWVWEKFLDEDDEDYIKEGNKIIDWAVRVHLLMNGGVATKVKMHDVVREEALWMSNNFRDQKNTVYVKSGVWLNKIPEISSKVVRRISLMSNEIEEISCSPRCPELSTLLLENNKLVNISGEFFRFMPKLVILDLSKNKSLVKLPEGISNLVSLKYLNMSHTGIKLLPVGLKELRKLILLDLDFTFQLESIYGIATISPNLEKLKLFCSSVCIDERVMEEIKLLKHLRHLNATVEDGKVLESIQEVVPLVSRIRALYLRNLSAPVVILKIAALDGLERLEIIDCEISEIKIDCGEKKREIVPKKTSPNFKNLSSIRISGLEGPRDLTWLVFAQNLKYLYVMRSPSVEEMINLEKEQSIRSEHQGMVGPFSKLEDIEVSDMDELKTNFLTPLATWNLRECIVSGCPKLPLSLRDRRKKKGRKQLQGGS